MKKLNSIRKWLILLIPVMIIFSGILYANGPLSPECTYLLQPAHGSSMVNIHTELIWAPAAGATGYYLKVGTYPGGGDILDNLDVGNVTTFDPGPFPCAATIFVTITPYDGFGTPPLCGEEVFETEYVDADAGYDVSICQGQYELLCASGGVTYHWEPAAYCDNPDAQCPWVNPPEETVFWVTVTNESGCWDTDYTTVYVRPNPVPNVTATNCSCYGCNNGTATANPYYGTPSYDFWWSTGETTQSIANLVPGDYSVWVTDIFGCTGIEYFSILEYECPEMELDFILANSCVGSCQGFIDIVGVYGGTPPYNYLWNTGATTPYLYNLCEGNYVVTVTDAFYCPLEFSFYLVELYDIANNLVITGETCFECYDGTAVVNPTGGYGNYYYFWSTGETTQAITNLGPGSYSVTVTDDLGCYEIENFFIEPYICPGLALVSSQKDACFDECTGYISISDVIEGIPPFTYTWSNGAGTAGIYDLCPGNYFVNVVDSKNCSVFQSFDVLELPELVPNASVTDETCLGCMDGTATVNPSGGSPPYWYSWSTGETTQTIFDLAPGTYNVLVGDVNECTVEAGVTIQAYECLELIVEEFQKNTCYGECNGSISIIDVTNGIPPFTYQWTTGETTPAIYDLCPGNYSVTITDSKYCSVISEFFVEESTPIESNLSVNDESCFGCNDGSASVNPAGGNPGYWYAWSTGSYESYIENLTPGDYSVTIGDVDECFIVESFTIFAYECAGLSMESDQQDACYDQCNGFLSVSDVLNGIPPFNYVWSNGETTPGIYDLCPGTYSLTITDAKNCVVSESFSVGSFSEIWPNAAATDETCMGCSDGTATVNPAGGTPPYWFVWSTGAYTQSISGLAPGNYTVTVGDVHECTSESSVVVNAFDCPSLQLEENKGNACFGACNGYIEILDVINGLAPFSYQWSNGASTPGIYNLCPDDYQVTVTDAGNCSIIQTFSIIEYGEILPNVTSTDESCENCNDGTATANPSGGTPPYWYLWSHGATTASVTDLSPGNYTVTVGDAHECTSEQSVTVVEFGCPDMTIEEVVQQASCYGYCDASITITDVSNTINTLMYSWSTGETGSFIEELCAGNYSVTVTDVVTGCTVTEDYVITQPADIIITIDAIIHPSSSNSGAIGITTNTDGTYTFSWEGPDGYSSTSEDIFNLIEGCYHLVVTNAQNCTRDTTICLTNTTGTHQYRDEKPSLVCIPNPAEDRMTALLTARNSTPLEWILSDISGKILLYEHENTAVFSPEVSGLKNGLYVLTVKFSGGVITQKIMISR